jgi:hypothetical protein
MYPIAPIVRNGKPRWIAPGAASLANRSRPTVFLNGTSSVDF